MNRDPMDHRLAIGFLPDLVSGELDETTATATREHVDRCPECREWVETYRLFERTLGERSFPEEEHPESALLALYVLRPEEKFELDRTGLRDHLEACRTCQSEVELLRRAVLGARPSRVRPRSRPRVRRRTGRTADAPTMRWGLLAAGLSAVAIGLAVYLSLVANPWSNPSRSRESDTGVLAEATGVGADGTEELSNLELEDSRVIETDRRLMVTNVKVKAGARITFRAGEVAAFGDGFQISDGGAIIVEVGKPPPRMNKRGGAS